MELCFHLNEYGQEFEGGHVSALITTDESYLRFSITFYKGAYDAYLRGEFFEEVLLHEFCHLLTNPLANALMRHATAETEPIYRQLVERQTELISRVMADGAIAKLKEYDK